MNLNLKSELFQINIPLIAHIQAEKFRSYQSQSSKAVQVYLNTLAVSAVSTYLNLIGWSTSLEQSDSWNLTPQIMMDVADLQIPRYGKLECRVVLTGQTQVTIPPEVWSQRIGYIIVRLNKSLTTATLLGFVRQVNQAKLPLAKLESLEKFPAFLSEQKSAIIPQVNSLSRWLCDTLAEGWQQLEELFPPPMTMNFRSRQELAEQRTDHLSPENSWVKLIELGPETDQVIALILKIKPQSESEFDISVKVCNHQYNNRLPEGLELVIVDQISRPVMVAQASETETIEFCFSGELGEKFSVEVCLDDQFKVENFII